MTDTDTQINERVIANIQASKTLDNGFLQKYDVKLYGSDVDNYNIINDFLQENQSEEAFYIIDLGEVLFVENFGAYTISAASSFNGFATTSTFKYIYKDQAQ